MMLSRKSGFQNEEEQIRPGGPDKLLSADGVVAVDVDGRAARDLQMIFDEEFVSAWHIEMKSCFGRR
jgi:hypothetical protein